MKKGSGKKRGERRAESRKKSSNAIGGRKIRKSSAGAAGDDQGKKRHRTTLRCASQIFEGAYSSEVRRWEVHERGSLGGGQFSGSGESESERRLGKKASSTAEKKEEKGRPSVRCAARTRRISEKLEKTSRNNSNRKTPKQERKRGC